LKCGYDGSVYLQILENPENLLHNPVFRISHDGKKTTRFSLRAVPGLENAGTIDFAPGAHGGVFILTTDSKGGFDETYVVGLDEAGGFISKIKLQSRISATQLAVFSTGEFLVSGREQTQGGQGPTPGKAFSGIIESHGQLVKEIELTGDIELKPHTAVTEKATAEKEYGHALSLSTAEGSNDGRVYLMRFSIEAPIFAISATGEVEPIKVPVPKGAYLGAVKVDGNKLVAVFIKKRDPQKAPISEVIFSVWDIAAGKMIEEFYGSPDLGIGLVCYRSGEFTFVSSSEDGQNLQLVRASYIY
jgi:hypothetical protein